MEFFHYINEYVFFLGMFLFLFVIAELAFHYGRYTSKRKERADDLSTQASTVAGTLLGLLALLLGFAFAMALGRFEHRKELLLKEINDIQTAYLRADLLPENSRDAIKSSFADYTLLRVNYYKQGTFASEMQSNIEETIALQQRMWNETVAVYNTPDAKVSQTNLFTNALSSVFDDQTNRTVIRNDHVPEAILWLLIFVAVMAICTSTYALGLRNATIFLPRIVWILAISSVMTIIIDLDRPIRGIIQINQHDMLDLHHAIMKDVEASKGKPAIADSFERIEIEK